MILLALSLLVAGCATRGTADLSDPETDPWEPANRKVFQFNAVIDRAIFQPIARGYKKVTPDPVEEGVGNFVSNLAYPVTILNLALQGKFRESLQGTGRFLLNSTFGVAGIFDVASREGIPEYREDFGQTLATWGYDDSRFIVLPIFGPSTIRDGVSRVPDSYVNPTSYLAREENIYWPTALGIIHTRAVLLPQTDALEDALDPYLLMRDAWLQNRTYQIHDGNPPLPDYESFLEEEPLPEVMEPEPIDRSDKDESIPQNR